MTDEMKLEIAKLRADGYDVEIVTNHNTDKYIRHTEAYNRALFASAFAAAWGVYIPPPRSPASFFTTEFKVTKKTIT